MFFFFSVPEIWKTGLTCLIGLATLIGIMTRPFRWNEAVIAMVGAAVLLLLGLIAPADTFLTLIRDWNTFLFFLGMMGISALAEAAGLFDWLTDSLSAAPKPANIGPVFPSGLFKSSLKLQVARTFSVLLSGRQEYPDAPPRHRPIRPGDCVCRLT